MIQDVTISPTTFYVVPRSLSLPQKYTPRRIAIFERHGLFSRAEAVTLGEVRDGLLTQAERYRTLQDERLISWHPLGAIEDQPTIRLAVATAERG